MWNVSGQIRSRPYLNHRFPSTSGRSLNVLGAITVLLALAPGVCVRGEGQRSGENATAIPMRDGVVLRADVLLPDEGGPFPVLVYRTPYGEKNALQEYTTFQHALERGYAVVVQDVRGRYASDGVFAPYQNEGRDGYDTIEWAAAQPWSNGKVGTFGLSYPGAVQWLAAMESPPHLVSIFPAMTFDTGRHFFYFGGGFNHDWMRWILLYVAPDVRQRKGLRGAKTEKEAQAEWDRLKWQWENYLPLREFP